MTAVLASIPAGTGTLPRYLYASSWAGIDNTGVTDSVAGFKTFLAACIASNITGVIDCPILLSIGTDDTKCIFMRTGICLIGTPNGLLMVDNSFIPAFVFHHTTDFYIRVNVKYVGAGPWDITIAPYSTMSAHFNDVIMKNDMIANFGNTFSGTGSSQYSGNTNPCAIFYMIGGCARGIFDGVRVYVDQGVNAANFIPVAFTLNNQWIPNTLVTNNNQAVTASTTVICSDIDILNLKMDGILMGIVGQGGVRILNMKVWRYSDMQKSDGTGAGGNANWFAPPHAIYLSDPDPSFTGWTREIINCFDYGIYVGGATRRTTVSGSILSLKTAPCNNTVIDGYTSLRPDGFMDCLTNAYGNGFGTMKNLNFVYDSSVATANGGSVWGVRFPSANPYNYLTIDGLVGRDLSANPTQFPVVDMGNILNTNCDFKNVKMYLADWPAANTLFPGFGMSGNAMTLDADYYFNQYSAEQTLRGSACMQGVALLTNGDVNVRVHGFRLFPVIFSAPPTGTSATLAASWTHSTGVYLVQFSDNEVRYVTLTNAATTATWAGTLVGTATTTTSGTGTVATVTFGSSGGVPTVGSSITLSGITPVGYNGTYAVTASAPGTVSYANTTTGVQTVAGSIANFTNATAQNSLAANYSGYKQRMLNMQAGKGVGNRIRVMDVTNGHESISKNGVIREIWSQTWSGAPTGATFDLPITIPSTHLVTEFGVLVQVALGTSSGLTTFGLGWSGTPTALLSAVSPAASTNPLTPFSGSIASSNGKTIRLTPTAGTFDGTGNIQVSITCETICASG